MNYYDFCKKHEPQTFNDITFADDVVGPRLLKYAQRNNFDNILLYGPFGSAKTTTAKLIMTERQRLLGTSEYLYSHEAKHMANMKPIEGNMSFQCTLGGDPDPYVIIEEVDALSLALQGALRSHINTFPVGRLILTTNEISKVDPGLVSRCDTYQISIPSPERYLQRALSICAAEQVQDDPALLLNVLRMSSAMSTNPSLRDMMRALHQRIGVLKEQTVPLTNSPFALYGGVSPRQTSSPTRIVVGTTNATASTSTLADIAIRSLTETPLGAVSPGDTC